MDTNASRGARRAVVPVAILIIVILYILGLWLGWPQYGTSRIVEQTAGHSPATEAGAEHGAHELVAPPFWTVIPFVLLLAGIAVLPLIPHLSHWWESNLNRFKVACVLALPTLAYYAFLHHAAIEGHWPAQHMVTPAGAGMETGLASAILANAMLQEFVPFIVLLFSLYTISG